MKIIASKKSQEEISSWPFWMLFVAAVGAMVLVIVKIGNVNVAEASRIPAGLEDEVLLPSRFYNSGDCFAYVDDVGRVSAKIIDQKKFTKDNLDKCYPATSSNYAFELLLEPPFVIGPPVFPTSQIKTFNWVPGKFENSRIEKEVMIFFSNKFYRGTLTIRIQNVK